MRPLAWKCQVSMSHSFGHVQILRFRLVQINRLVRRFPGSTTDELASEALQEELKKLMLEPTYLFLRERRRGWMFVKMLDGAPIVVQ